MKTSDERQEVAARLRELRHRTYYREEVVEDIIDAISIADPVSTFREPEDIYELLADLIDPTCEMLQSYMDSSPELNKRMEDIALSPEDTVSCICQGCGWDFRYDRGIRPSYCPNCGARVVSGDE